MAQTMKAAVFEKPNVISIKQVPVPQMPVYLTRISTSWSPSWGTGICLIFSTLGFSTTAAFIV